MTERRRIAPTGHAAAPAEESDYIPGYTWRQVVIQYYRERLDLDRALIRSLDGSALSRDGETHRAFAATDAGIMIGRLHNLEAAEYGESITK